MSRDKENREKMVNSDESSDEGERKENIEVVNDNNDDKSEEKGIKKDVIDRPDYQGIEKSLEESSELKVKAGDAFSKKDWDKVISSVIIGFRTLPGKCIKMSI